MKKRLLISLALAGCMITAHADTVYRCPNKLDDNGKSHRFINADVFEGVPEDGYLLRPDQSRRSRWVWESTEEKPDFYLRCYYQGTDKTLTLAAKGAKQCTLYRPLQKGSQAVCR